MKATFHEQRLLTAAECDRILELWEADHGHGPAYDEDEDFRSKRTSIVDLPDDLCAKVRDAVEEANARFWGYEGEYHQAHEIYRYEPGDFFDWHMDLGDGELAYRKLTTLVQLSRSGDYEGGRLEIFGNEEHEAGTRRGTLLVYPSYVMHRVTEVTAGVRFSLGGEFVGPSFR